LHTAIAAAMLSVASPALAAAPVISGKYLLPVVSVCQPSLQVTYTAGSVSNIAVASPGSATSVVATAKFDPSTQMVSVKGAQNSGSTLLVSDNLGHSFGAPFVTQPVAADFAWSSTGSTVTIDGTVFQAVYGKVKKGVAETFMLAGIDSGGCSVTVNASKY
jgi:hypothetical protein